MANRYPLVIDSATKQIKELPSGDNLNLTGNNIVGLTELSVDGNIALTGNILINETNILELVSYNDLNDVPSFSTVAFSGNYNDLNNVPLFSAAAFSGSYNDLVDTPPLADVATSGDYNSLSNRPLLSPVATSGDYGDLINRPIFSTVAISGDYGDLNNRPEFSQVAFSGSYLDLNSTPTIPDDISDLTDTTGILTNITFINLPDTPAGYATNAGKYLRVNLSENGLEFSTVTATIDYTAVIDALGFVPYNSTNPEGYISGESDTLDSVVARGSVTASTLTVGGISSSGTLSGSSLTVTGNIVLDSVGALSIDGAAGSTLTIGGGSSLNFNSQQPMNFGNTILPSTNDVFDLGSTTRQFSNAYINDTVYFGDLQGITGKSTVTIGAAGNINITAGTATSRVDIFRGVFKLPSLTTTERNALSPQFGDIIYNESTSQVQIYVAIAGYNTGEPFAGWVNIYNPPAP